MKRVFFLAIICSALLAACHKDAAEKTQSVTGKWLWLKSKGSIAGSTILPAPGVNRYLEVFSDSTYKVTENTTVIESGLYSIRQVTDIFTNTIAEAVIFDPLGNNIREPQVIDYENGQLLLRENCPDCYTHYYQPVTGN